jgi:hypothetical protein
MYRLRGVLFALFSGTLLFACSEGMLEPGTKQRPSLSTLPPGQCTYDKARANLGVKATKLVTDANGTGPVDCAPTITLNPTGKLYQSGDTRSFASDPVYTGPVTITFDQPVYNVDLFAEPWIFCPTVDVKMYNGATQVVSQTFTPDPSVGGCDQNGMTTAAYVRPTYDGAVTKIVIEAPAVTQKQIINSGGFPETAYFHRPLL